MRRWIAPLCVLPLAACLENEEEITVHADGSVEVTVRAHGDGRDLADGFAVPLHAPWIPQGPGSELWQRLVGPATGGEAARATARGIDWDAVKAESGELVVESRARFASVADWPRFTVPEGEAYREAFLEREASLRIERRGPYTVYSFERTLRARQREGRDLFHELLESLEACPEDLAKRLEDLGPLAPEEWRFVARELGQVFGRVYRGFAEEALAVEDDALPRDAAERVADVAEARLAAFFDEARLMQLVEGLRAAELSGEDDSELAESLEREARELLRTTLGEALEAEGLAGELRYTVLGRLEFAFTAADHTSDLADEKFRVALRLPGLIVSGNYDELDEEGRARWSFEFDALSDRDVVLRAVSIVE